VTPLTLAPVIRLMTRRSSCLIEGVESRKIISRLSWCIYARARARLYIRARCIN